MRLPGETNRLLAVGVDSPGRHSAKHVNEDAGGIRICTAGRGRAKHVNEDAGGIRICTAGRGRAKHEGMFASIINKNYLTNNDKHI